MNKFAHFYFHKDMNQNLHVSILKLYQNEQKIFRSIFFEIYYWIYVEYSEKMGKVETFIT